MTQQWKPIASAPKTGRTLLLGYWNSLGKWRTVRGQWMSAEYIGQEWDEPDGVEAGWFETAVEADDVPNCWPVSPSHWQPMPEPPCQTCNDQGAVGNILTAEPCPECTHPASAQDDAKDERQGWVTCETRRPWVTNSLKASAQALREKETRLRTTYTKDFMGVPSRFVADAYGEAAAVFEAKLDLIAASQQQEG